MTEVEQKSVATTLYACNEEIPESQLIADAQAGDSDAFQQLYGRHKAYVSGQFRRFGCGVDLTDELTQEVFVRLWRKIKQFKGQSAFRTWLHRITVNVVLGHFRTLRRDNSRRVEFSSDAEVIDVSEWLAVPSDQDDRILVSEILSAMPAEDQILVKLYIEGYKHREISELLGVTTSTSRSQLFRVRQKIEKDRPRFRYKSVYCVV